MMLNLSNKRDNKRLFEGWKAVDWFNFFIGSVVFGGLARFLIKYVGTSNDWTLAVILVPIAIFAYIQNKKKTRHSESNHFSGIGTVTLRR